MGRNAVHVYMADGKTFLAGWVTDKRVGSIILEVIETYGTEVQVEVQEIADAETDTGDSQAAG